MTSRSASGTRSSPAQQFVEDPYVFPTSHKVSGAIAIPLWLVRISPLSQGAALAYGVLCWAAGGQKAVSNTSVGQLAVVAKTSVSTFHKSLKELEHRQLVERSKPLGDERCQRYRFLRHPAMYISLEEIVEVSNPDYSLKDEYGFKVTPGFMRAVVDGIVDVGGHGPSNKSLGGNR